MNAQVAAVLRRAGYKGYEIYPDPASEAGRRRCEEYGLSCKDETPTVFRKRFQIDWGLGEADELGTVKVELTIQYADG